MLAGYLSLQGPGPTLGFPNETSTKWEQTERLREGWIVKVREQRTEKQERDIELPRAHRMDIVFRYPELCVWVFALNRRTRRKTRGLLRPRGLSYQIDAPRERHRVGTGMGLKASIIFQRLFIGRRALQQAQSLVALSRSPREHGSSQLVWDWLVLATGTRAGVRSSIFLSLSLLSSVRCTADKSPDNVVAILFLE